MPEYRIIAKIDPAGVSQGRAKIKQELSGLEADVQRTGKSGEASFARTSAAAAGLAGSTKSAGVEAAGMAAAAQASARGLGTMTAGFKASEQAARLNTTAMRETLVVARELARGNFTRLPGSATLLAQGIGQQGGIGAYGSALANQLGLIKTTQDAELALAAADAAAAESAVRAAAERAAANVIAADTELALAQAAVTVAENSTAEAAAQARLVAAHEAVSVAAAEAAIAENALAVSAGRAGVAAAASAATTVTALNPLTIGLGLAAAAAAYLAYKFLFSKSAVEEATQKLKENAEKVETDRQAHEAFEQTLVGEIDAIRRNTEELDKLNHAHESTAQKVLASSLAQVQFTKATRDQVAADLAAAKARYQTAASGGQGKAGLELAGSYAQQVNTLQAQLDKIDASIAQNERNVLDSISRISVEATQKMADPIERIKAQYATLIDQARKHATEQAVIAKAAGDEAKARSLVGTELQKQIAILTQKEKLDEDAARKAQQDAKKLGEILALPISGGTITTRFGQVESGAGVGPHVHQGVDIATPVGTPVYARSGGTVDFARQQGGYGNVIQINFGGGVTARYGHLQRFNVKPGDVVDAGDIVGFSGGARGAEGVGDSTGPHLHYEERVGGRPVNPLTARVNLDAVGGETAGFRKAEEAAKAAARVADEEKNFVQRTVDAANETALPKIDALAAKIKKAMDDYRAQFHAAMSDTDKAKVVTALTAAEAREEAQHFNDAYVVPLKQLQAALGQTAVERQISNATIKEEADLGRDHLSPEQEKQIRDRYELGDQLERENKLLVDLRQPLEDYRQEIAAVAKALAEGKINQTQFNARVSDLNSPLRQLLANAPPNMQQPGGFNVNDASGVGGSRNYQNVEDASKAQEENARYADELAQYDKYREQLIQMGVNYDSLEEAARQRHIDNLNGIDQARRDLQLSSGQQIADSVYQIAVAAFGKHSALARAAFAVEKGFVIARAALALYDDVAQAIKVGFPQNIPLIAQAFAQGAIIIAAIKGITAPSGAGYMAGGYTGDIGRGSPAGIVHGQEFVVNAEATARNRSLLEAINSGQLNARSRAVSNDNQGGGRPVSIQFHNFAPGVEYETQPGASADEVVVIARRVVRDEAPGAVAADMANPNGRTSKGLQRHFGAQRSRG